MPVAAVITSAMGSRSLLWSITTSFHSRNFSRNSSSSVRDALGQCLRASGATSSYWSPYDLHIGALDYWRSAWPAAEELLEVFYPMTPGWPSVENPEDFRKLKPVTAFSKAGDTGNILRSWGNESSIKTRFRKYLVSLIDTSLSIA